MYLTQLIAKIYLSVNLKVSQQFNGMHKTEQRVLKGKIILHTEYTG